VTIAGLSKPFTMQGVSLLALLKNPRLTDHDDQRFFEFDRQHADAGAAGQDASGLIRGVVTRNYKFVDYPEDPGNSSNQFVLYDLKRDPDEMDNLKTHMDADDNYKLNYNPVLSVLLNGLGDWRKRTHDGNVP
jgi:arylsulfatase A-like enzyme